MNSAISIVNELNTVSEKQVYLDVIKKLTDVPVEVLSRDLTMSTDTSPSENKPQVEYFENAVLKSVKFVLASLCFKKDYATYDFDLTEYLTNPTYKKIYQTLKSYHDQNKYFQIGYLFDDGEEKDSALTDILEYNFEDIQNPKEYYKQCIWKIRENYLKNKSSELTKSLNECTKEQRPKILRQISEVQKKLREKILED